MSQRAVIETVWSAVTSSVSRRDRVAAAAALSAAVREGLLQTAGPAALLALQSSPDGGEVESLLEGLRERDWPGDDVSIELITAALTGTDAGRGRLEVDLDMLGDVLNDQRGGYLDRAAGTVWPVDLVEDGQVEGLNPFEDADPDLWLDVPGEDSREAYQDMADFTADLTDPHVRDNLAAALEARARSAVSRRPWISTTPTGSTGECSPPSAAPGRARPWLADQGYDAVP